VFGTKAFKRGTYSDEIFKTLTFNEDNKSFNLSSVFSAWLLNLWGAGTQPTEMFQFSYWFSLAI